MTSWLEIFFFLWSCLSALGVGGLLLYWRRFGGFLCQAAARCWPWGVLDAFGVYLVIALANALAISGLQGQSVGVIQTGRLIAELAAVGVVLGYLAMRYGMVPTRAMLGVDSSQRQVPFRNEVAFGIVVGVIAIPLVLRIQIATSVFMPYSHPTLTGLKESGDPLLLWSLALKAIVTAPILEEILYRGVLQGWLQRIQSTKTLSLEGLLVGEPKRRADSVAKPSEPLVAKIPNWPIFASSLLFAAAHLNLGASAVPLFFFGLVLGYLFRHSGSILPCILVHMMLNAYSIALVLLQ